LSTKEGPLKVQEKLKESPKRKKKGDSQKKKVREDLYGPGRGEGPGIDSPMSEASGRTRSLGKNRTEEKWLGNKCSVWSPEVISWRKERGF